MDDRSGPCWRVDEVIDLGDAQFERRLAAQQVTNLGFETAVCDILVRPESFHTERVLSSGPSARRRKLTSDVTRYPRDLPGDWDVQAVHMLSE